MPIMDSTTAVTASFWSFLPTVGPISVELSTTNVFSGTSCLKMDITLSATGSVVAESCFNLSRNGIEDAELEEVEEGDKILIRLKQLSATTEPVAERVISIFKQEVPDNTFVVESSTEIGPTVGRKLQRDAVTAVVLSMIGIVIYIALRF